MTCGVPSLSEMLALVPVEPETVGNSEACVALRLARASRTRALAEAMSGLDSRPLRIRRVSVGSLNAPHQRARSRSGLAVGKAAAFFHETGTGPVFGSCRDGWQAARSSMGMMPRATLFVTEAGGTHRAIRENEKADISS